MKSTQRKKERARGNISVLSRCRWNKWIRSVTAVNSLYRWHDPNTLARIRCDPSLPLGISFTSSFQRDTKLGPFSFSSSSSSSSCWSGRTGKELRERLFRWVTLHFVYLDRQSLDHVDGQALVYNNGVRRRSSRRRYSIVYQPRTCEHATYYAKRRAPGASLTCSTHLTRSVIIKPWVQLTWQVVPEAWKLFEAKRTIPYPILSL